MSGASSLASRNVLGLNKISNPNVLFVGEEFIVFPAGNSVAVHNINSRAQRIFTPPEELSTGISAISIADGKPNVAFSDNSIQPSVCVFDIHTLHPRTFFKLGDDFGSTGFVSLSFSGDGKYLLGHGTHPGWKLVVWDWENNQMVANIKTGDDETPVSQCSFSPGKNPQIAVTGNNILKVYKLESNKLIELNIPDPKIGNIVSHLWQSETLLLCSNSSGDIISVTTDPQTSVIGTLEHRSNPFVALSRYKKGFLGATDGGYLMIFEPDSHPNKFSTRSEIKLFGEEFPIPAHSITVDPSEETAIVTLENNRIISVSLSNGDILLNMEDKPLVMPFHDGPILCCSTCCRKPLIATCGEDKTVRVWNYLENSLECVKEYTESVYSVSFHPDGLMMLIGFGDRLRLCSVFYDDIRQIKEFGIRGCRCAKFSNGGHLFAAVNAAKIQIYSTLNYQLINTLHRHSAGVHSLIWAEADTVIASVGNDGAMYIHRADNTNRDESCTTAQVQYQSITALPDLSSIYICGSDMKLKEIQNGQIVREILFPIAQTQLIMSNNGQMLFSGSKDGKITSFSLPIGGDKLTYNYHTASVTSMAISFDDSLLFTAGEDGVLCIFNIRDKDNRVRNPERSFFSDEVLTTRGEIEEKANQLRSLEADKKDMEGSFALKKDFVENTHKSKQDKKRELAKKEKDKWRIQIENTKKEKDEAEMNNNSEEKKLIARCEKEIEEFDGKTTAESYKAHQQSQALEAEKEALEAEGKSRIDAEKAQFQQIVEQRQEFHRQKAEEGQTLLEAAKAKKEETERQIEEMKKQILTERAKAIEDTEKRLADALAADAQMRSELNDALGTKSKDCAKHRKQFETQQAELAKETEQKGKYTQQLDDIKKEIDHLNEETSQREISIHDRELKIQNVKKENQELEKYHAVLTHQETMLRKQMDPLNEQIQAKDAEIAAMDSQLEAAHKKTTEQNEQITDLHSKLDQVINLERSMTKRLMNARSYFEQMKHDLHEVVQFFHAKDQLKETFKSFYAKYVENEKIEDIQLDEYVEDENRRQKTTLQKQLKELRNQHARDDAFQSKEQTKLLMQNAALITELQKLRQENKSLTSTAALTQKPSAGTSKPLLPATEAAMVIKENKMKIQQLEEQLESYSTNAPASGRDSSRSTGKAISGRLIK